VTGMPGKEEKCPKKTAEKGVKTPGERVNIKNRHRKRVKNPRKGLKPPRNRIKNLQNWKFKNTRNGGLEGKRLKRKKTTWQRGLKHPGSGLKKTPQFS